MIKNEAIGQFLANEGTFYGYQEQEHPSKQKGKKKTKKKKS